MTVRSRPLEPLEIAPEAILARLVLDHQNPLVQYAPHKLGVSASTTEVESPPHIVVRLACPLSVWASCMADDDARAALLALLGVNGRAYFVVAVAVSQLESGKAVIAELEYVEVVKTPAGPKFDYEPQGPSYCTCGRDGGTHRGTSTADKVDRVADAVGKGISVATQFNGAAALGLSTAGFGAAGVARHSWAAARQAKIGSVQKGSLFSFCQRLGARGGLPVLALAAVGAVAAGIAYVVSTAGDRAEENERPLCEYCVRKRNRA